jgi:hypothetical protein
VLQNGSQRRIRLAVVIIVGQIEGAAGRQGEVVRLAKVGDRVVVRQQRTIRRQRVDVGRLRDIVDDLVASTTTTTWL